jgi:hypothetical protein
MLFRKPVAALALLTSLTATTAFGVGMDADEPTQPAPALQQPAPGVVKSAFVARVRLLLTRVGVDPDSANGKAILAWAGPLINDPDWLAVFTQPHGVGNNPFDFNKLALAPAARLQVLKDIAILAPSMPANSFNGGQPSAAQYSAFLNALSPEGVSALENLLDVMVKQHDTMDPAEHYSTAELIEMESGFEQAADAAWTKRKLAVPAGKGSAINGQDVGLLADVIVGLPEPLRTRASWSFFPVAKASGQAMGSITAGVLADPYPYLAETFDDHSLPAAMRARLPADGARPLAFKRLVIEGTWVEAKHPDSPHPYRAVYLNLHDNGVVDEAFQPLVNGDGKPGTGPADFSMSYGLVTLRSQRVGYGKDLKPIAQVLDSSTVEIGSRVPAEGEQVEFPAEQPSADEVKSVRCLVGKKRPAAAVFPILRGDAVDLSCTQVAEHGADSQEKAVWLLDYGITVVTSSSDEYDSRFDIKSVSISPR